MNEIKRETLRYLGCGGRTLDPDTDARVDRLIEECRAYASPKCAYAVYPVAKTDEGIELIGTTLVLGGNDIARHIEGADSALLIAFTLGAKLDRWLSGLSVRSSADALIGDAAASAIIEHYADTEERRILPEIIKAGERASTRFSPGYGDMPITLQPAILRVLNAGRKIGLTCTADDLLIPRKSVTAVIGIGDIARKSRRCGSCTLAESCAFRKEGRGCDPER